MQSTKYTIHQKSKSSYKLQDTDSQKSILITNTHQKYDWVSKLDPTRLVSISHKGRWSSSKDYNDSYSNTPVTSATSAPAKQLNISLTKLDDLNIDDSLFVPMQTDTIFDKFVSSEGGFLPGTNINCAGAPGVGKTTVLLELLSKLHDKGKKVLFISAEMGKLDMARYLKRFPHWGQLPMLFLADYLDDAKLAIEQTLQTGWDVVLTDSFTEVNDTVKESNNLTRGKTEKWFFNLMESNNSGHNKTKKYTTFLTILQLSKGGTFVGSNKISHLATAMMYIKWDGNENSGKRYMEFVKNRGGDVNKKLYYDLEGGVNLDSGRYARDLFNDEVLIEERTQLDNEGSAFDKLFGLTVNEDIKEMESELSA